MNNKEILARLEEERCLICKVHDFHANGLTVKVYKEDMPSWFMNEVEFEGHWQESKIENRMKFRLMVDIDPVLKEIYGRPINYDDKRNN